MKLSVSQRVTHTKYGLGVISELDSQYTVIDFDEFGVKKFLTRIVTLESSDEPLPKRRRRRKATTKAATSDKKKKTTKKAAATKKAASKTTKKA